MAAGKRRMRRVVRESRKWKMALLRTRRTRSDKNSSRESEISIIHEWESLILDQCRRLFQSILAVTNRAQVSSLWCCWKTEADCLKTFLWGRRPSESSCDRKVLGDEQLSLCSLPLRRGTARKWNRDFVICWKGFMVWMRIWVLVFTHSSAVKSLCTFLSVWNDHILQVHFDEVSMSESAEGMKVGSCQASVCDVFVGKKWAWVEVMGLLRGSPEKQSWSWSQDGAGADVPGTGTLSERAWLEAYPLPWARWRWADGGV